MKRFRARDKLVRPGTLSRALLLAFVTTISLLTPTQNSFGLEPPPTPGAKKVKAGFAFMAAGLITTGIGAGVYVANEYSGKTTCTPCAKTSWVLPTVLMSLGGAMFVTGGTFLTIGLVENSRPSAPTATLSIGPFGATARLQF